MATSRVATSALRPSTCCCFIWSSCADKAASSACRPGKLATRALRANTVADSSSACLAAAWQAGGGHECVRVRVCVCVRVRVCVCARVHVMRYGGGGEVMRGMKGMEVGESTEVG